MAAIPPERPSSTGPATGEGGSPRGRGRSEQHLSSNSFSAGSSGSPGGGALRRVRSEREKGSSRHHHHLLHGAGSQVGSRPSSPVDPMRGCPRVPSPTAPSPRPAYSAVNPGPSGVPSAVTNGLLNPLLAMRVPSTTNGQQQRHRTQAMTNSNAHMAMLHAATRPPTMANPSLALANPALALRVPSMAAGAPGAVGSGSTMGAAYHPMAPGQGHSMAPGQGHSMAAGQGHSMAAGQGHSMAAGQGHSMAPGQSHSMAAGQGHSMAASQGHSMAASQGHSMAAGQGHAASQLPLQHQNRVGMQCPFVVMPGRPADNNDHHPHEADDVQEEDNDVDMEEDGAEEEDRNSNMVGVPASARGAVEASSAQPMGEDYEDDGSRQAPRAPRQGPPSCYRLRSQHDAAGGEETSSVSMGDHSMSFTITPQQQEAFESLDELRREERLCDVVLVAGGDPRLGGAGEEFPCHRVVLAASSDYFRSMFTLGLAEETQQRITLTDVPAGILAALLSFMYTATIVVSEANVCQLMQAAMMLQLRHVIESCVTFIGEQLDETNCIGIQRFAEEYQCDDLALEAQRFIERNFGRVRVQEEFRERLDVRQLAAIVESDSLHVVCENEVYEAVMGWVSHDPNARSVHLYDLLLKVRLPLVPPVYLEKEMSCNNLLRSCHSCVQLIRQTFDEIRSHKPSPWDPRVCGEVIYCVGGFLRHYLTNVECYDAARNVWRRVADLPQPRSGIGACSLQGRLYAVGGRNNTTGDNMDSIQVDAYDPETNTWSSAAPMREARYRMGVAVLDNCLYAIGGSNGSTQLSSVEKFCPIVGQWSSVAPMNEKRHAAGVAVVNRFLYAVGGMCGNNRMSSVEKYYPEEEKWTTCAPMSTVRSGAGVCAMDHYIYVAGGYDSSVQLASAERYDTLTDKWETLRPMKMARSAASMVAFGGKLYVFGGFGNNQFIKSVECYDPKRDEWRDVTEMSSGRGGPACAVGITPVGV